MYSRSAMEPSSISGELSYRRITSTQCGRIGISWTLRQRVGQTFPPRHRISGRNSWRRIISAGSSGIQWCARAFPLESDSSTPSPGGSSGKGPPGPGAVQDHIADRPRVRDIHRLATGGRLSWKAERRESNGGIGCASVVPGNATPRIPASSWVAFRRRLPPSRGWCRSPTPNRRRCELPAR
jgi:hypothetical protein